MKKEQMESALLAARGSRAGAVVPATSLMIRELLIANDLMTEAGNLTERGARRREYVAKQREDEAFG